MPAGLKSSTVNVLDRFRYLHATWRSWEWVHKAAHCGIRLRSSSRAPDWLDSTSRHRASDRLISRYCAWHAVRIFPRHDAVYVAMFLCVYRSLCIYNIMCWRHTDRLEAIELVRRKSVGRFRSADTYLVGSVDYNYQRPLFPTDGE